MQVSFLRRSWIKVRKDAVERLAKCDREGLCTGCLEPLGGERNVRGLHAGTCYQAAQKAIRDGKTTEEDLVAKGFMRERLKPGRKPSNPVTVALSGN